MRKINVPDVNQFRRDGSFYGWKLKTVVCYGRTAVPYFKFQTIFFQKMF